MRLSLASSWTAILFLSFLLGCILEDPVSSIPDSNLLLNPSFEIYGIPSLLGWVPSTEDTSAIHFFREVPPQGGKYSLGLETAWTAANSATAKVPAMVGSHRYRLALWARSNGVSGFASLYLKTSDTLAFRKTVELPETAWTSYSLIDTIVAKQGDSLFVSLSGGMSQLLAGRTLFDLCTLEILNGPPLKN